MALAYYVAEPRATRDIDVNVSVGTEEAERVLAALPDGIEIPPDGSLVVARDGQIRLWWDGRSGIPVDVFFPQHELHDDVARDTHPVPFLDTEIPIISATHLAVFKALFNRARDWPDIAAMLQVGTVDANEALSWVGTLVGADSGPYRHLSGLVLESAAGLRDGRDRHEEPPVVDWSALGDG